MLNLSIALIKVFSPGGGRQANKKLPALSEPMLQLPGHQLARMIRDGQLSSERLVELMSERLRQVQPLVNAMCQERFSEALDEARQLDSFLRSVRSGQRQLDELTSAERELLESPLLGVPVSVKESIQVRGMRNSCGLWARRHEVASEDAVVVANVRRYGMIPICTSNIPECTLFWADCQNCVYGRSLNPYDGARITGASSGGEGALLGSGASILGIGSDIGGSLRIPAHYCGVYSHKPSPFLLSCEGNFPAQKAARLRMFTLGPMCRYASDLRPMLKCLMRDSAQENKKLDSYYKHQPENIAHLRQQLLIKLELDKGLECVLSSEATTNNQQQQTKTLKVYYFEFNEQSSLQGTQSVKINDELAQGQRDVLEHLAHKFAAKLEHLNLDKYLKKCLITWQCLLRCASKQDRDEAYEDDELKHVFGIESLSAEFIKMPFGLSKHTKESLLALILGSAVPRERQKAFELCEKFELHAQELREEIIEKLTPHDANNEECVLIMPTLPTVAYKHNVALAKTPDIRFPALFNVLQLPVTHATIRLDKSHGLPYGVSIAARPYADHLTLAVAEEIELAFGGWTPPGSKLATAAANSNTTDMSSSVATIARPTEANAATINQKAEQQTKTTMTTTTTTTGAIEQTAQ